jgi:hypothetical protein
LRAFYRYATITFFFSSAELPSVAKIKIPKERYSSWDAPGTEAESDELEKFVIRRSDLGEDLVCQKIWPIVVLT